MQPPAGVPYVVDNLWEWTRPERFPDRRYAVFASPSVELAAEMGGTDDGSVFEVDFDGPAVIAQLEVTDGRLHRDCKSLPRLLRVLLGPSWFDLDPAKKCDDGRLYLPCLRKEEVEEVITGGRLAKHREEIWDSVTFWELVTLVPADEEPPDARGEIFFQADRWSLVPIL